MKILETGLFNTGGNSMVQQTKLMADSGRLYYIAVNDEVCTVSNTDVFMMGSSKRDTIYHSLSSKNCSYNREYELGLSGRDKNIWPAVQATISEYMVGCGYPFNPAKDEVWAAWAGFVDEELEFTDEMMARIETVDNAIHACIETLADRSIDRDVEMIEDVTEAIREALKRHKLKVKRPAIEIDDETGKQRFTE